MPPESNLDVLRRFVDAFNKGKVTRVELFLNRDDALEAAGLTANIEENK